MNIRKAVLHTLVEDVEKNLARFDPTSGRFLTGDGWAVTNQDLVYPLALLYQTQDAENPYYQDARILDFAQRGGDAWRDFQYPDGKVEFVKVDGSKWGPIYMPWSMYHWLESYALLRPELDAPRRQRWEEGLTLAYDGIAQDLAAKHVHNIPTWNGMATYRAGQLFDRADWLQAGQEMIQAAVANQQPGGYWLEHHGPTPAYNYVYVHALGLYHLFSGDASVLPAIQRALDFHIRYTYPDGRTVETIDGRVKYHDRVSDNAYAAFSLFPQGRRYVRLLVDNLLLTRAQQDAPHISYIVTSGSLKIASAEYGLSPRLASAYAHYQEGPEAPIPQDQANYAIHDPDHALIRRQDGWFTCISGVVTPAVESRWGQDRQSYLSVWHEKSGLIAGGGNAKDQPDFSTFVLGQGDDRQYMPSSIVLQSQEGGDAAQLYYGPTCCNLQVIVDGPSQLRVVLDGPAEASGRLTLKMAAGKTLTTANGEVHAVDETELTLTAVESGGWIAHGSWQISLPPGSHLRWPVRPFNPYAADGAGPLEEAVAVLAVPLGTGPQTITLQILG